MNATQISPKMASRAKTINNNTPRRSEGGRRKAEGGRGKSEVGGRRSEVKTLATDHCPLSTDSRPLATGAHHCPLSTACSSSSSDSFHKRLLAHSLLFVRSALAPRVLGWGGSCTAAPALATLSWGGSATATPTIVPRPSSPVVHCVQIASLSSCIVVVYTPVTVSITRA